MSSLGRRVRRLLSLVLPYRPLRGGQEYLDAQYRHGVWGYLRERDELARFSVLVGYCQDLEERGRILEIGCGEGVLQERLCRSRYARYVGVDVSAEAVARALGKHDEGTTFVACDAALYAPEEAFDLIVFNECLEYFEDPVALVRRYEPFLARGGRFLVSMFAGTDTLQTRRIWRRLAAVYETVDETRVTNRSGFAWVIRVLAPRGVPVPGA